MTELSPLLSQVPEQIRGQRAPEIPQVAGRFSTTASVAALACSKTRLSCRRGSGITVAVRTLVAFVFLSHSAAPWTSNPADDSAVIVAASVHAGIYQRSVRRWVSTHLVALNQRPSAIVSVCLAVLNRTPKVDQDLGATLQRFSDETR